MKTINKIITFVLIIVMLSCVTVYAEEPEEATPTDVDKIVIEIASGTDIVIPGGYEDLIDRAITMASESDADNLPSPTDVESLITAIKEYLAAIELPEDDGGIGQYVKDTLMPIIFQVLTSIAAIYGIAYPALIKIKLTKKKIDEAAGKFSDAAADVKEAIAEKKAVTDMQNEITALKESTGNLVTTIVELKAENEGLKAEVQQLTGPVKIELDKITQAIKIGMCNTQELVNNGYAARIIKELDGEEDVQTQDETPAD